MKSILFVDDEPKVLNGLKRMLLPYGDRWQMEFACGGAEALTLLAASSFDVVVTDMRMPGMDGATLLNEVARLYPQMVRMILSGTWEQDVRMQAAMVAHQYLSKPCDPELLKVTLDRAFALRDVLVEPALRALISRTASLPSTPAIYRELMQMLQKDEVSARQIGIVLAQDMGMTAKVLQLVNSAFFGLCRHITSLEDAVIFLGIDTVKVLALSASAFSCFHASGCPRFSIEALQRHSTTVAWMAREIAKSQQAAKPFLDDTFVAGLLHDVGQLVLVSNHPEKYTEALSAVAAGDRTIAEAERETFGTTHAEVGGYLLWLWGLPDSVVEAVVFHHSPSQCPSGEFAPLTAVHAAGVLEHAHRSGIGLAGAALDTAYLTRVGAAGAVPAWWLLAQQQNSTPDVA
jgi:HD-like signal output (HDOD) protein/ActR/RegA family two-component response regulator